jgi:diguanylate cyclase (GGDEF)-like protein/PAS domain S-box-containing protein
MTQEGDTTVLVVDDTPDRLDFMGVLLRQAGYRVLTSGDGAEGLEVARRERPLLIISDVMMPRVSGIELCRRLRADAELSSVSILLVSAMRRDDASAVEGLRAGADDYLEAPFDPMRLVAKTARLVERARLEAVLRESEERYALAARGANDGLWDWDLRNDEVYYSARWKEMLGLSADEAGASTEVWLARVHPEDVDHLREEIRAHIEGAGKHLEVELRVLHADGDYLWMLCRGAVVRDGEGRATRMAGSMTDVTRRKCIEEQLLHDAFHDALTGLPNRALFMDRLGQAVERAKRHGECQFAVLFLDLDRFKTINDSLGHDAGDRLLVEVSRRLEGSLRAGDTVARLGGDEFTVLLESISDPSDAVRMAERIQVRLAAACQLGGPELFVSASMGVALSAFGFDSPEEILRAANTAMHRAKKQGRGCQQVFDSAMHSHTAKRLRLETDMRSADARDEYEAHYQPIMSLATGRIAGFEALVRWRHPERGLVLPGEFIPLSEETGAVTRIDRWVLREACRHARIWHERHGGDSRPTVSVNLSARSFLQPDLADYVEGILGETSLGAGDLNLEITESVLLEEADSVKSVLFKLRDLGVGLHLDDFGTGYSSLSYLRRFPISALKVDRSFVAGMGPGGEGSEITRAIIALAHSLQMEAVAEGVEAPCQLELLRGLGCEYGQGFYFSRPVDASKAGEMVRSAACVCRAVPKELTATASSTPTTSAGGAVPKLKRLGAGATTTRSRRRGRTA